MDDMTREEREAYQWALSHKSSQPIGAATRHARVLAQYIQRKRAEQDEALAQQAVEWLDERADELGGSEGESVRARLERLKVDLRPRME